MIGMFLYNNVIIRPFLIKKGFVKQVIDTDPESDISPIIKADEERETYSNGINEIDSSIVPTMNNPAIQKNSEDF